MNRGPVKRPFLALFLSGLFASVNAADDAHQRAARYYAEGLEKPLLQLRAGAELVQSCGGRLRRLCSAEQRKLAAGFSIITLLDALTLFPQRLDADPTAGISTARAFADRVQATSAALLREAGEYDRELFARVRAALVVCPATDGPAYPNYLEGLEALERVHFEGFQALAADKLVAMREEQTKRAEALEQKMRAAPREDCEAARRLGEYLMQLMNSKLKPWQEPVQAAANPRREFDFDKPSRPPEVVKDDAWRARDRELAHAVAGNFVSVVATELQITVHPESETPLKEMAEAVEGANQTR
jgi:hypothetical protein